MATRKLRLAKSPETPVKRKLNIGNVPIKKNTFPLLNLMLQTQRARQIAEERRNRAITQLRVVESGFTKRRIEKQTLLKIIWEKDYYDFVTQAVHLRKESLRIVLLKKGKIVHEFSTHPEKTKEKWLRQWYDGPSDEETFIPNLYDADEILIFKSSKVETLDLKQIFRDSKESNCVFDAIRKSIEDHINFVINKKTKQNYESILRKSYIVEKEYPNGVPQDKLKEVSEILGIKIQIDDIIGNEYLKFGGDQKRVCVRLRNLRKNHVENYSDKAKTTITQSEMKQLYMKLRDNKQHYLIKNGLQTIRQIETINGTFVDPDPLKTLYDLMNEQIKDTAVDALKHPNLNEFLKQGRIINSSVMKFKDFEENTKLYDMKQAYAKFEHSKYYEGFLFHIHQFRKTDKIHTIGIYEFEIVKSTPLSRMFGLSKGFHILPSPEIKFWRDNGLVLNITKGAWGSVGFLNFSDEFVSSYNIDGKTIKPYQIWCGKLSMSDNYRNKTYTFRGDYEFAGILKNKYPDTIFWENQNEIQLSIPNKYVLTHHHIYAGITSYTRLNMLEQIVKMDINNIQAILLDGIYTTEPIVNKIFVEKPILKSDWDYSYNWYNETDFNHDGLVYQQIECVNNSFYGQNIVPIPESSKIVRNSLLTGGGGAGKTYSIFNDKGFIDVLYVTPTRELGEKSGHNWITIHKLVGLKCQPYHTTNRIPNVILIDEITMIHDELIEKAIQMYPHSLILLAGDVNKTQHFQCRNGSPNNYWKIFQDFEDFDIIEYTNDYRSLTQELKDMKIKLRTVMQNIYTDGGIEDTRLIRKYLHQHYTFITLEEAIKQSTTDDVFIVGTHNVKNKIPFETHTIHSFQGQTIDSGKIYITDDFFEYAMAYTAISRARYHTQIVFVKSR